MAAIKIMLKNTINANRRFHQPQLTLTLKNKLCQATA